VTTSPRAEEARVTVSGHPPRRRGAGSPHPSTRTPRAGRPPSYDDDMEHETGRLRGRWHRASPGRRLAGLVIGLLVATALVTVLGVASQPVYPEWSDDDELLDDLRLAPSSELWSTDLAALGDPRLPAGCRGFRAAGRIDGDALVTSTATAYDGCESPVALLARIDPTTGETRWVLDLTSRLDEAGAYLNVVVDDDGSRGTVIGQTSLASRVLRVDLDTGTVLGDVIGPADDPTAPVEQAMGISRGRLLVALQPPERITADGQGLEYDAGDSTPYRLIDLDDPDRAIWSGELGMYGSPFLLGEFLVVEAESQGAPTVIDTQTGEAHPVPGDIGVLENAGAVDDLLVVTVTTRDGDREAVALDRSGDRVWTTPLALDGQVIVTDDCVVVTDPPSTFRCLEAGDGGERWQRRVTLDEGYSAQIDSYQQLIGGSAVIVHLDSREAGSADLEGENPATLMGLSPLTGATTFSAEVPSQAFLTGLSRTVGFASSYIGQDFSQTIMTAFDLSDGRTLWQERSPSRGTLDLWAGTLVSVDAEGVAHGLRTRAEVVPPTADDATSPLG
jgi:outer membrane protein assembly factor BamB